METPEGGDASVARNRSVWQVVGKPRTALRVRLAVSGIEHPDGLWTMNSMASLLRDQGKLAEAEQLYVEVLRVRRAGIQTGR